MRTKEIQENLSEEKFARNKVLEKWISFYQNVVLWMQIVK